MDDMEMKTPVEGEKTTEDMETPTVEGATEGAVEGDEEATEGDTEEGETEEPAAEEAM